MVDALTSVMETARWIGPILTTMMGILGLLQWASTQMELARMGCTIWQGMCRNGYRTGLMFTRAATLNRRNILGVSTV